MLVRITLTTLFGYWFILEVNEVRFLTYQLKNWIIGDRKTLLGGWRMQSAIRATVALFLTVATTRHQVALQPSAATCDFPLGRRVLIDKNKKNIIIYTAHCPRKDRNGKGNHLDWYRDHLPAYFHSTSNPRQVSSARRSHAGFLGISVCRDHPSGNGNILGVWRGVDIRGTHGPPFLFLKN